MITRAQRRSVSLATPLKGCEASSPVASSLYYLPTDVSIKLPFIIEQRESSAIFRFSWWWENKECVLSCSLVLSKL